MRFDFFSHDPGDPGIVVNGDPVADQIYGTSGSDSLSGNGGDDVIIGRGGNDFLSGGAGNDILDGGAGIDTADYSTASGSVTVDLNMPTPQNTIGAGIDTLTGIEKLIGSAFADTLKGDANANLLSGGGGDDVLIGGGGSDTLTGGAGADHFFYNATSEGLDHIVDFAPGTDVLDFKSSAFGNLTIGTLSAANFDSNATGTATHAAPEFIYNTTSHVLSFDADGTGAAVAIQMAHLENGVPLTNASIHIVA